MKSPHHPGTLAPAIPPRVPCLSPGGPRWHHPQTALAFGGRSAVSAGRLLSASFLLREDLFPCPPSPPEKQRIKTEMSATWLPLIRRVQGVGEAVNRNPKHFGHLTCIPLQLAGSQPAGGSRLLCVIYPNLSPRAAQQSPFIMRSHSSYTHNSAQITSPSPA